MPQKVTRSFLMTVAEDTTVNSQAQVHLVKPSEIYDRTREEEGGVKHVTKLTQSTFCTAAKPKKSLQLVIL
jgi:hypothetical protein